MSKFTTGAQGINIIGYSNGAGGMWLTPTTGQPIIGAVPGITGGTVARTTLAGPLLPQNGGLGLTTYTAGDIPYTSALNTMATLPISPTNVCLLSGVAPSWGKVGLTTHVSGILARANGGTGASLTLAGGCIIVSGGVMAEVPLANGQVLLGVTGGPPIACTFLTGANMIVTPGAGSLFLNTNIAESDKIPASTTTGNLSNVVSSGFWYPVPHTVLANALPVDGSMIEFFYTFNYTAVVASQPTYSFGGAGGPITTIQIISSNSAATAGNGYLRVMMARTGLESAALQFELLYNDNVKILRTSENVGYNVGVGGWAANGTSLSIGFSVLIPALPATFNLTGSRITYFV